MSTHRSGWTAFGAALWLVVGCAGPARQTRSTPPPEGTPVVAVVPGPAVVRATPAGPPGPSVPAVAAEIGVDPATAGAPPVASSPTPTPPGHQTMPPPPSPPPPAEAALSLASPPRAPAVIAEVAVQPQHPRLVVPDHPGVVARVDELLGPGRRGFASALRRSGRYLPMIRRVLKEADLPEDLVWLALVESHFLADARSRAGAVGLWQFIETTARAEGLRVDWWVDERLDPERATRAAARHLAGLHKRFGDWNLALAAYNAGAGGVDRALARTGARTYWELVAAGALRSETSRYVPKFYATVVLARDPVRYGFDPEDRDVPSPHETLEVAAPVDLVTLARLSGTSRSRLEKLNPALLRGCTPPGGRGYPVRLEPGTRGVVAERLAALPGADRLSFLRYRLRSGDTLWAVGRRYGTRPRAIAEINGLDDPRLLRPGREIVVPVVAGGLKPRRASADRAFGRPTHEVRRGDTVWRVAHRYAVGVDDILRWNGLGPAGVIRPGDVLVVGLGARPTPVADGRGVHVVRRGETLWALSRRYRVALQDLQRWNGLADGAVLRPGDRLRVEGGPS